MAKDGVESHSKILHIPMHRRRVYFLRCAPARPRLTSRTVCRRCERSVSEDRVVVGARHGGVEPSG